MLLFSLYIILSNHCLDLIIEKSALRVRNRIHLRCEMTEEIRHLKPSNTKQNFKSKCWEVGLSLGRSISFFIEINHSANCIPWLMSQQM